MLRYAYIHCKPDGTPFYVGKGALRRTKNFQDRNPYHKAIVAKYGRENILIGRMECSSHRIAYDLEAGIIKCLKRMGVALANLTAGGDGGKEPCAETRVRLSEAAKRRGVSLACQEAKVKAKTGTHLSEEQKEKLRIAHKGKTFTQEHRENISISAKKRGMSDELLNKTHQANLGRKQSDEEKQKRGLSIQKTLESTGRTTKVLVDGVLYVSIAKAAKALLVSPAAVLRGLRGSGVVKGHTVKVAT